MYVHTGTVTLRTVDRNVADFLPNRVLIAARAQRYEKYKLDTHISGRARGASKGRAGAATHGVKQSAQSTSIYAATPR